MNNDWETGKNILKNYGLAYGSPSSSRSAESEDGSRDMYRAVYQVLTPHIDALIEELHKIMGYLRTGGSQVVFEGITLYGPGTMIRDLDAAIERQINISTKKVNPLKEMGLTNGGASEGASLALVLGLAMGRVTWL